MPPSGTGSKRRAVAEGGEDRLSALPDGPLLHVLSFLPSRDSVRTCVLARRYRDLWKFVGALRVASTRDKYKSANALNKFVNYMLVLRHQIPLHEIQIKSYAGNDLDESFRYVEVWIRHAISFEVRVVRVCITSYGILEEEDNIQYWLLPSKLFTSMRLTKIELIRVESEYHCLDFTSCPALKDLRMEICNLFTDRITSPSLQLLCLTYCRFKEDRCTQISVPNLISLQLVDCRGRTPLLQSMPLLVSAFVRLRYCDDSCDKRYEIGGCGDVSCGGCSAGNIGNNTCVLLEGLSGATHLELISETAVFVFRKDLTRCPVFNKLKTLLLNDWCITLKPNESQNRKVLDLSALICILQHSPSLEKLILQLQKIPEDIVGTGASYDMKKQPFSLKHLTVEVRCQKADGWISEMLHVLVSYGWPPNQIKTQQLPKQVKSRFKDPWPAGSLSFEQERT